MTNTPDSSPQAIASKPYASLLVCAAFIALQIVLYVVLIVAVVESDGPSAASMAWEVLMVLWLLIPAGALYGIYLARPSSGYDRGGGWLRGLGLLANLLYLMIGMFMWLIVLSGVRV